MAQNVVQSFKSARQVSTSLFAIKTPDIAATMASIVAAYADVKEVPPILCHDIVRGLLSLNEQGHAALLSLFTAKERHDAKETTDELGGDAELRLSMTLSNPVEVLVRATQLPRRSILFLINAQRFLDQPAYIQAIWNLRDQYKADRRSAVMIGHDFILPKELSQDVLVLDEPFPGREQLAEIVKRAHNDAKLDPPKAELVEKAVDALRGLAAFPAEQVTFMSLVKKDGMGVAKLDLENIWERKRQQVEQTHGLTVWRGKESFSQIQGLSNLKKYGKATINGKRHITEVLFLDEIN